jgi:hypothetical protein
MGDVHVTAKRGAMDEQPDDRSEVTVPVPRPRLFPTLLRGALYGLVPIPLVGVVTLSIHEREARMELLAVVGGIGMLLGMISLATGLFLWLLLWGHVLRWRDVRSEREKYPWQRGRGDPGVSALGPILVRLGVLMGIMGLGLMLVYYRVEAAPDGSWLCCRSSGG